MSFKLRWQWMAAFAAVAAMAPDLLTPRTKPRCLPGLPTLDWQQGSLSRTETALSLPKLEVLLEQRTPFSPGLPPEGVKVTPRPIVRERLRYFQIDRTEMRIDHCSITRVAVTLHENGLWTLSLRADQNPWMAGQPARNGVSTPGADIPEIGKFTLHLKRNQFFVRVRCYANYPIAELDGVQTPGKPVLFELRPEPFWVQRGQPFDFLCRQPLADVSQYFDLIDRVEVEFFYR